VSDRFDFDAPFEPAEPAAPAARRVLTVGELTAEIRGLLENTFYEVWVEGEISNCRLWNTGHLYFTLKDDAAQLKAVMFRSALRWLRFKPAGGLRVIARGRIGVYEPKGEYQIVCEHLEPQGRGALQLAFEQLKRVLQEEGLFDGARKRPLPILPRKIGIVTSLDGAAVRDILNVLRRRYPNAHVVIRPSRVQGEGAAADLARGLGEVGRVPGVDVIIIGRGGGSIEDLWAFNEEVLARAIGASPVPVISAVGHEVDFTIADFAADLRAPTPSAAAEIVVARKDEYCARIDRLGERLRASVRAGVERRRLTIHRLASRRALAAWPARLALRGRHVAELTHELRRTIRSSLAARDRDYQSLRRRLERHDLHRILGGFQARLVTAGARLREGATRARHDKAARLHTLAGRLESLSPLGVLGRGYAVCWNDDRTVIIRDASSVVPGQHVHVTLHKGALACEVRETAGGSERS
jgi:exodeoxyribonuclease VII large subunit